MSFHKKDIPYTQKLEKIRKEISLTEFSGISGSEYTSLLAKQNKELLSLLENSISFDSKAIPIPALFEIFEKNLAQPACIFDSSLVIIQQNDLWKKVLGEILTLQPIIKKLTLQQSIDFEKILDETTQNLKQSVLQLILDEQNYYASILPLRSANCFIYFVMILFKDTEFNPGRYFSSKLKEDQVLETNPVHYPIGDFKIPDIYKALLDAIDGFYFVADNTLIIKDISLKVTGKLGYTVEEMLGESIKNIMAESSIRETDNFLKSDFIKANSTGKSSENVLEVLFIDNEGNLKTFELLLAKFAQPGKSNDLFLGLCTDIQKRKEKEIELYVARVKAEDNDKMKSDFLANMSHEIRTPLNGIIGFSTMLERENLSNEKRERYLHIIHTSTHQLLTMVNDIIDISKIEASKLKIENRKCDLHQILDDLYVIFTEEKQRLEKNPILLKKSFGYPHDNFIIKTDEIRLKQVIGNLLSNALKFTEKGEICFGYSIEGKGTELRFFVRDSGLGIPESMQDLIFGRYRQTEEGAKIKYKGAGLGLSISKGIVELMGGRLDLISNSDKGSEFFFTLPLHRVNHKPAE